MPATTAAQRSATPSSDPSWMLGVILGNHSEPVLVTRRVPDGGRSVCAR